MILQNESKVVKRLQLPLWDSLVDGFIKSPLNYTGGKFKILGQILPSFPKNIDNFVDLFAGGCNVGINVNAKKVYFNDNLIYLVQMYKVFQSNDLEKTFQHIEARVEQFELSLENDDGYKKIRNLYNEQKNPLDLFVLIAFSFNHQIRFNSKHEFNTPFGKERSSFNASIKENLRKFIIRLQKINAEFSSNCFKDLDLSFLGENDLVYCDPPYLITTGSYNDGKRGFKGWTRKEENELLEVLDKLNSRRVKFALSNVLEHKGKTNDILKNWVKKNPDYIINFIDSNYSNSNYHTLVRDKNASMEVLITNYESNN